MCHISVCGLYQWYILFWSSCLTLFCHTHHSIWTGADCNIPPFKSTDQCLFSPPSSTPPPLLPLHSVLLLSRSVQDATSIALPSDSLITFPALSHGRRTINLDWRCACRATSVIKEQPGGHLSVRRSFCTADLKRDFSMSSPTDFLLAAAFTCTD